MIGKEDGDYCEMSENGIGFFVEVEFGLKGGYI